MFKEYIIENDKDANIIFIDYNLVDFEDLKEYKKLIAYIDNLYNPNKNNYIMIDEVQMCDGFEIAINNFHAQKKYDIYIIGSNAFLLSSDLATLFTGRVFSIEVYPFSYKEFLEYYDYENNVNSFDKSNLIKAFTTAILMVRNSSMIPLGGKWDILKPFLFSEDSKNNPSEFEFVFIANKIKYKYFFSADEDKIYNESLDAYYSQKPTNIFTRKNTAEYNFINSDRKTLESIASKNTENKLFLASATTWNYEKTKDAFLWFLNSIDTYDSFGAMLEQDLINYSNNDEDLKKFTLKLLKESDIFIKDLRVSYEERDVENSSFIINNQKQGPLKTKRVKIAMDHEIINSQNEKNIYTLDFEDESSGTRILFALAPILKRAFEKTKIIIVDELEKSLHPTLVKYIIKLFNNEKLNTKNSQLIFTTHAISLLNLESFRRDQIWFTEKDVLTGNSDLYPLDSFSVRKEENIEKGYINGRYGAIPFIKDIDSWLEEK